jgi:ATP-dependent exoDNAse (exonuclease V) alpha subunit
MRDLLLEYTDNQEAQDFIRLITYTNDSVFLTGKAGTGKSELLNRLIQEFLKIGKKSVVLAPTGIAALQVGGQTINSFFQLEPRLYYPNEKVNLSRKRKDLIKELELIIIDEISMVRSDIMNQIDLILQHCLENKFPFGGIQLLLIGDLFQLPPIIERKDEGIFYSNYKSAYFFGLESFKEMNLHIIELQKNYRQNDEDKKFIEILDKVRNKKVNINDLEYLNKRKNENYEPDQYEITLATRKDIVKEVNDKRMKRLDSESYEFRAIETGNFKDFTEANLPTERNLVLKKDAQVIFIKNDSSLKRWANGTIGKIEFIDKDNIKVNIQEKGISKSFFIERMEWENSEVIWNEESQEIKREVLGTFSQYPIKLAWAITIHKSQGQTFDKVTINLGTGAFANGQAYVALSRCRDYSGITLKTPIRFSDIMIDENIVTFLDSKKQDRAKFTSYLFTKIDEMFAKMSEKIYGLSSINKRLKDEVEVVYMAYKKSESEKILLNNKLIDLERNVEKFNNENKKLNSEIKKKNSIIFACQVLVVFLFFIIIMLIYTIFK